MLFKKNFNTICYLSFQKPTLVKICRNLEFMVEPQMVEGTTVFHVKECKGDFKILRIQAANASLFFQKSSETSYKYVQYDTMTKTFIHNDSKFTKFEFNIEGLAEFKHVDYVKVSYELQFSSERMMMLELLDYYKIEIILPGYEYLKFQCYLKKHEGSFAEIYIENPYDLRIEGNRGDYKCSVDVNTDFDKILNFVFDPSAVLQGVQSAQELESRPDSVVSA